MTGRDLVTAILKKIGAVSPGQSISASEAQDGLAEINRMISSWSNERLLIYATEEETFVLTADVDTYTLGPGADWNTTRPQWIENAVIRDLSGSESVDYPIDVYFSVEEYARISVKDVTSPYPYALYDDGGFPNRTIKLYPRPSEAFTIALFSAKPITSIATLDTVISLPPGFEDALVYNGAVRLASEYGRVLTPEILGIAMNTKAGIKRANHKPRFLKLDPTMPGQEGRFSVYTGEFR